MQEMQCYRLRSFLCDIADMTRNTISTLFLIRQGSHFAPLHSPDSADSLIFFTRNRDLRGASGGEFTLRD